MKEEHQQSNETSTKLLELFLVGYIYIYIYIYSAGAIAVVFLKPRIIKIQANSLHIYRENLKDLDKMAVQKASKNSEVHNENAIG